MLIQTSLLAVWGRKGREGSCRSRKGEKDRRTFVANFRLVNVSLRWACSGLIMTNMRVFELPPRENCRR